MRSTSAAVQRSVATALVLVLVLAACDAVSDRAGSPATEDARVAVRMTAPGRAYAVELRVPEALLSHHDANSALVRVAYPDFGAYSARDGFLLGPDAVVLSLALQRRFDGDAALAFGDRNDLGRFIFENHIQRRLTAAPTPDPLPASIDATRYVRSHDYETLWLLRQPKARLSVVKCVYGTRCNVSTSWNGAFSIEYSFGRDHFLDVLELDRRVFDLVDSFEPHRVEIGE